MIQTLLVLLTLSGFIQKWSIPQGIYGSGGRILIGDTDRDGSFEFYMTTYGGSQKVCIYELHLPNTWEVDSFSYFWGPLVWDLGDFDLDGVYDLVIQTAVDTPPRNLISIAESPDSFSCPTSEVWRDTVGFALVQPISAYDVDQDNYPEIFKLGWRKEDSITIYYPFGIYEYIADNQYDTVFMGTGLGSLSSTMAFGDFDGDSMTEFVVGNISGWYQIWECVDNNQYILLEQEQLSTGNIKDCFAVPDVDGDGKWEFVVKGYAILTAEIHAFIFESIADNTYEIIQTFNLPGGDYSGGYSDAGDVDDDSIPEIVLEARQNVFVIKSAGNNAFYLWDTLPGHGSGSNIRVTDDIDDNGLNEIVVSGANVTRIYEYDGGSVAERREYCVGGIAMDISPNPFSKLTNISFGNVQGAKGIELKIYDATGREVKSFSLPTVYSLLPTVTWDGTNDAGQPLSSGVYFIHLDTPQNRIAKKVVLLR